MGLSARKVKQRIGHDPRNLTWADDAARFGQNYLAKFGWDSSKGLGVSGDGRTTHVKVSHKLDMLGIGAAHQKDPNGIAWKQNRDFENLLKRLNEGAQGGEGKSDDDGGETAGLKMGGLWTRAKETSMSVLEEEGSDDDSGKKQKKRKRKDEEVKESGSSKKKRKKESGKADDDKDADKKEKKKKKKRSTSLDLDSTETTEEVQAKTTNTPEPTRTGGTNAPIIPRHRPHRARIIAAKRQASLAGAALSEILGIAPTAGASSSTLSSQTLPGMLTPTTDDNFGNEHLTISRKSVTDYFKEKLSAASKAKASPSVSGSQTPVSQEEAKQSEAPRAGLGSHRVRFALPDEDEDDSPKVSKKFSALMSSFSPASTTSTTTPDETISVREEADTITDPPRVPIDGEEESQVKERKKEKKKRKTDKDFEKDKKRKRKEQSGSEPTLATPEDDAKDEKRHQSKEERKRLKAEKKARKREQMNEV